MLHWELRASCKGQLLHSSQGREAKTETKSTNFFETSVTSAGKSAFFSNPCLPDVECPHFGAEAITCLHLVAGKSECPRCRRVAWEADFDGKKITNKIE